MSTRINIKILSGAISVVVLISAIVVLNTNSNNGIEYFEPLFLLTDIAELHNQSTSDSSECVTELEIQKLRDRNGVNFQLPTTIPNKYRITQMEAEGYVTIFWYSFGNCNSAGPGVYKGTLEIRVTERDVFEKIEQEYDSSFKFPIQDVDELSKLRTDNAMTMIERDKVKLARDIYQTRTINGHIAYGHDPSYVYDRYYDENENPQYRQLIEFPGKIQFVDEDFSTGYSISGMFSFSELVSIAESISE